MKLRSPNDIFAFGHRALAGCFEGYVEVSEKIDGSQFSFQRHPEHGMLFRSRGRAVPNTETGGLFGGAVQALLAIQDRLNPEYIYRGEVISKPRHNTLTYDSVPEHYFVCWDIEDDASGTFLRQSERNEHLFEIGITPVRIFHAGDFSELDEDFHKAYLTEVSMLGGPTIEGVVIKAYDKECLTSDNRAMGKIVSDAFKEKHEVRPSKTDIITTICQTYGVPARYAKAVQHLKENGEVPIIGELCDLRHIVPEIQRDLLEEEEDAMKEMLWNWFKKSILKGCTSGVPKWYKKELGLVTE